MGLGKRLRKDKSLRTAKQARKTCNEAIIKSCKSTDAQQSMVERQEAESGKEGYEFF